MLLLIEVCVTFREWETQSPLLSFPPGPCVPLRPPTTSLGPHSVKITALLEQRVADMLLGSFPTFLADLLGHRPSTV